MKFIKINIFVLTLLFIWGCDKNEFAELNSNPSEVSTAELPYSATECIKSMYSDTYTYWFYSMYQYVFPWTQITTVGTGGNGSNFNTMGAYNMQNPYGNTIPNAMDLRFSVTGMSDEEQAFYSPLVAITYPIVIWPMITRTDMVGSQVYTEAGMAPYNGNLTPVYDDQETLLTTWLDELDDAIDILENLSGSYYNLGKNDLLFQGDYNKWVKFCNLLKLRIAARLINTSHHATALAVAEEVANSSYMDDLEEDAIYNGGVEWYGSQDDNVRTGYASKNLIDFMVENRDPRVRFIFEKNDFNAEVVQAFLDAGKKDDLPPYVKENINFNSDTTEFESWKIAEPWVRYYGAPLSPDAASSSSNKWYFDQSTLYRVTMNDVTKEYEATSYYSNKNVGTGYNYTYPTKPGGSVLEQTENVPLEVIFGTSAETNLYLAEFKLLGANLPQSAQNYFDRGVQFSVARYDAIAENNEMPYYNGDPVYSGSASREASTALVDGEIENLLSKDCCDLSTDALEKVYIQQFINFMGTIGESWAFSRRTGIPMKNSSYLAWEEFLSGGNELVIPRRFSIDTPSASEMNYENEKGAYDAQGFTTSTVDPSTLNSERIWYDKSNPSYGAGPN